MGGRAPPPRHLGPTLVRARAEEGRRPVVAAPLTEP